MIPSYHTLEVAAWARMEDRAAEAEQQRLMRLARQDTTKDRHERALVVSVFVWLRQFALRVISAEA
jgi:hypothetical protein